MPMTGFICQDEYLAKCAKLSDQEVGRLFRALMQYHATGHEPELAGRESIAFDFIKDDIDRADKAYDAKCEKNRQNRSSTTVNDRQRPSTNTNERPQNKSKIEIEDKEKTKDYYDDNSAGAWISDSEIADSLDRDRQIEEAAASWGLPHHEGNMIEARDMAREYSLDWLLRAIQTAGKGKEQTWRYVRGILRSWKENGGPDAPRKQQASPAKVVSAQQYQQREYTEDQLNEISGDLLEEARALRGTA